MRISTEIDSYRTGKPRSTGLTIVLDRLLGLNRSEFEAFADFVDIAEIGWGLPLLVDQTVLGERIRTYHEMDIKVSTAGTLLEVATSNGTVPKTMKQIVEAGFDMVEISERNIDLNSAQKQQLIQLAKSNGLEYMIGVGRKNSEKQLTPTQMLQKIGEALKLESPKVILDGGEEGNVGIYDENGRINWELVNEVAGTFGPPNLIFEAPKASQQVALILEFGPGVNIGNVALENIPILESERRGLRGETFGFARHSKPLTGSPAVKFIFHLITADRSVDQTQLVERSGLPRRTVQSALNFLKKEGFIREIIDIRDSRRHKYAVAA